MLSLSSLQIVAAIVDNDAIICSACAVKRNGEEWDLREDARPITRYEAHSEFPDGISCDSCGAEIVEPCLCECEEPEIDPKCNENHCGHCLNLIKS